MFGLTLVIVLVVGSIAEEDIQGSPRDSYLDALSDSHGGANTVKTDREGYYPDYNPGYPDAMYNRPQLYPEQNYGPPKPVYGPPVYPPPQYGPPHPHYGPPEPFYGMPHAMLGLIDKLKFKLDLFTIGKILLKLVIFKKIVSLIAILCLLLFIPSLKHKITNHDDVLRTIGNNKNEGDDRMNNITSFIMESIQRFSDEHDNGDCGTTYCKAQRIYKYVDENLSYDKLSQLYINEL